MKQYVIEIHGPGCVLRICVTAPDTVPLAFVKLAAMKAVLASQGYPDAAEETEEEIETCSDSPELVWGRN